jgi:hypothetical protein
MVCFTFSSNIFASQLLNIKNFTNPEMTKAKASISKLSSINYSSAKKVLVLKATGSTLQEKRQKTVAQALHTLCPYFDDGIALGLTPRNQAGLDDIAIIFESFMDETSDLESLKDIAKNAMESTELEVYNGETSGNNTVGAVMGIYDVKNQEILVFASTNCGSDD